MLLLSLQGSHSWDTDYWKEIDQWVTKPFLHNWLYPPFKSRTIKRGELEDDLQVSTTKISILPSHERYVYEFEKIRLLPPNKSTVNPRYHARAIKSTDIDQ